MKELDDKKWRNFRIPTVFSTIQRGKRLKKADHIPGIIPYVSSSANNNGVDDYIEASQGTRAFADCISLANSGSVGTAFYEPFAFVASDHVTILKRKQTTKETYLFLTAIIKKQGSNFNFNREINEQRIMKMQVMLPITDNGKPDYDYMAQYSSKLRSTLLKRYENYISEQISNLEYREVPQLEDKKWRALAAFGKHGFLKIATTSSSIDSDHVIEGENKKVPYVTRKGSGNGIAHFVSSDNLSYGSDSAGCITVGLDTQTAYWQPYVFTTGQNIQVITGRNLSFYLAQFVIPLLRKQMMAKFNWGGNGATLRRMKELKIMLPVDDAGNPDYNYMEQYSKNMLLRKYHQYLDFLTHPQSSNS